MVQRSSGTDGMLAALLAVVGTTSLDDLPDVVDEHARRAGLTELAIYVGDLERRALHLLRGRSTPVWAEEVVRIRGTVAGHAYQYGTIAPDPDPDPAPDPGGGTGRGPGSGPESGGGPDGRPRGRPGARGVRYWVPLSNGLDRVGMMSVTQTEGSGTLGDEAQLLATLIALVIVTKRGHSDTYAGLNRTRTMNVAAEAQWQLMPPRAYMDARVALAATLEPAYQISGDAYDYAIAGPVVHLSIFDAMGHDTAAGQSAALAVAASRSARHRGASLAEAGHAIEQELLWQFGGTRYATAVLASLETRSGVLTWANFGHYPVLLLRGGEGITLRCAPALPLGTGLGGLEATTCRVQLRPGDRIALYTDGITEARRLYGREFGMHRLVSYLTRHHPEELSVPETVRRFVHAFLDYHSGRLTDDATVLLCEWPGPRG